MTVQPIVATPQERIDAAIKELQGLLGTIEGRTYPALINGTVVNEVLLNIGVWFQSKEQRLALNAGCLVQRQREGNEGQMYDELDIDAFSPLAQDGIAWMLEAMCAVARKAPDGVDAA